MKKITIFCMLISSIFANQFDCYNEISRAQTAEQMNIISQVLNLEQRQINQNFQMLEIKRQEINSMHTPIHIDTPNSIAQDILNPNRRFDRLNQTVNRLKHLESLNMSLNLEETKLQQKQIWLNGCINLYNQKVNQMNK
ncbi:hypothetical protein OFN97_02715 [Campylobacter sp. VBCF_05 NA6]|uniref:hypothetical protein n=1 Tax=unclassified Campylobacter TaxID=2593542 RepID=UPI0022EA0D1A|nr:MULTISPECIES: hypothetical protein [unclassified Campylobacter]MDA3057500.1 hypothetical protein [Campylobacter sp. VBCF_04 NA7]MDA3058928.1 hypothetical protein [Campylobacter sp. VBCF_05 NA6]MDA3062215.1 hypothetical protein [Campylobacter sp. JMF_14 EL1]MDA3073666.1 hypothetical protein [Campylobacter sp. JMF_10 EL2]